MSPDDPDLFSPDLTPLYDPASADLQQLYDAALPADAPGAWIRRAIERDAGRGPESP